MQGISQYENEPPVLGKPANNKWPRILSYLGFVPTILVILLPVIIKPDSYQMVDVASYFYYYFFYFTAVIFSILAFTLPIIYFRDKFSLKSKTKFLKILNLISWLIFFALPTVIILIYAFVNISETIKIIQDMISNLSESYFGGEVLFAPVITLLLVLFSVLGIFNLRSLYKNMDFKKIEMIYLIISILLFLILFLIDIFLFITSSIFIFK